LRALTQRGARLVAIMLQTSLTLPLGGCLLTGALPEPALDIPAAYDGAPRHAAAALPKLDWWRSFRSRELTHIVEAAREANLDIAASVARIVQADAQARITGAALLPVVGLGANASHSRASQSTGGGGVSTGGSERDLLSTSLTASYEIDFWGKNRSALRAAEQSAVASRFDREVVSLATVVSAANAYFQVLSAQDRLRVARENLKSATDVLNLIKDRLNAGTASTLEVAEQQSVVNTLRAAIPPLQQTLKQNRTALAI
jgi:multidrug efflux system outer membrane protein